jgi:ribonuclease P protein component
VKKENRLRASSDFARVRKAGRSWSHSLLALCILPNDLPYSRFGFAASSHVGTAVARNHAKRLMREAVRLRQPLIQPGWDMVFIARKSIQQADYRRVDQAIAQLFRQANVLRENAPGSGEKG